MHSAVPVLWGEQAGALVEWRCVPDSVGICLIFSWRDYAEEQPNIKHITQPLAESRRSRRPRWPCDMGETQRARHGRDPESSTWERPRELQKESQGSTERRDVQLEKTDILIPSLSSESFKHTSSTQRSSTPPQSGNKLISLRWVVFSSFQYWHLFRSPEGYKTDG